MKNWFELIDLDRDIKEGNFDPSVFAADLYQVWEGEAPSEYQDPFRFFQKTYITKGLEGLLARVQKRLRQGKGDRVLNIQTPFGGGKTHSLISLYHFVTAGSDVEDLLPDGLDPVEASTWVMAGSALNPVQGNEVNGLHARTLWGDLGAQMGGEDGYNHFQENDETLTPPGSKFLKEYLRDHQPFVLLMDEVLHYVNAAQPVEAGNDYLGSLTLAFCQQLTEAVTNLENGVLLATLPDSELENFGSDEQTTLSQLEKIFGRKEAKVTPVQHQEIYYIVQNRLFEETLDETGISETVNRYFEYYNNHPDQFPGKVRGDGYRDQLEKSYPFHPDLIDTLYQKWGTFSSFQRTRGVLSLLGQITWDLYEREVNTDLILPGHVNLERPEIRRQFIEHIGEEYDGIIDADIAGPNAKAPSLESEKKHRHLAEKIATSIFLHSFTAGEDRASAGNEEVKLATLNADQEHSLVTDTLQKLENELWYLSKEGTDNYYFSHVPNLNRMIIDKKDLFEEEWKTKFSDLLQEHEIIGDRLNVIRWPNESRDIPDKREIQLVLLAPDQSYEDVKDWIRTRGNTMREYRNILIFSEPDPGFLSNLRENINEWLALDEIQTDLTEEAEEDPRTRSLVDEVEERRERLEENFPKDVLSVYRRFIVNGTTNDLGQPSKGRESLTNWYRRNLEDMEMIAGEITPRLIKRDLLGDDRELRTSIVRDQFYKNTDLPKPPNEGVIKQSIRDGVRKSVFGLGYKSEDGAYVEVHLAEQHLEGTLPNWDEEEFIVSREFASEWKQKQAEEEEDKPVQTGPDDTDGTVEDGARTITKEPEEDTEDTDEEITRYVKANYDFDDVPAEAMAKLIRGVINQLHRHADEMNISLRIESKSEKGISETVIENQVRETIRQLKQSDGVSLTDEELEEK